MTGWTRLHDYTELLRRGNLIRCALHGTPAVMMLREPADLVVLTGDGAGTLAYELPREALDPRWLARNWSTYVPSPVEDVAIRGDLDIDEIAATPRTPLIDFAGTLEQGRLLECPFGYPFEGRVYMMVTEVDMGLGFVAITGYKAGIRAWWVPPLEASNDAGIDSRWLIANSDRWLFGGARLAHVFVRDRLTPAEL
jgi:hypothetical protein